MASEPLGLAIAVGSELYCVTQQGARGLKRLKRWIGSVAASVAGGAASGLSTLFWKCWPPVTTPRDGRCESGRLAGKG